MILLDEKYPLNLLISIPDKNIHRLHFRSEIYFTGDVLYSLYDIDIGREIKEKMFLGMILCIDNFRECLERNISVAS